MMSTGNVLVRVGLVGAVSAGALLSASPALAVFTADNTSIGSHPNYPTGSALWRTGLDYSVLTQGPNTYFNTPNASGSLLFRAANAGAMGGDPDGSSSNMWLAPSGLLTAGSLHLKGPIPSGQGYTAVIDGNIAVVNPLSSVAVLGATNATVNGIGVLGTSAGTNGMGVEGVSTAGGTGVQGTSTGTGKAIRGDNTNINGWAGYFNGRAFTTAGVWSGSDVRLKKDIKNMSYGLNEVLRMRPVTYFWKTDIGAKDKQLGMVAQEMQTVIPEAVTLDQTSGMYSINYPTLVPVLIKAVQELQATVKKQEKQIVSLEGGRAAQTTSLLSSPVTVGGSVAALPLGLLIASRLRGKRERRKVEEQSP